MTHESCRLIDRSLLHEQMKVLSDDEQARQLLAGAAQLLEEAAYAAARIDQGEGAKLYLFYLASEAEKQIDRLEGKVGRRSSD